MRIKGAFDVADLFFFLADFLVGLRDAVDGIVSTFLALCGNSSVLVIVGACVENMGNYGDG